jgi:uncharacterized RmlC-like cupin family protein
MTEIPGSLHVIKPADRRPDVASGSMLREVAIAGSTVGAAVLWVGYVELGPGMVSDVHHHGEAESGIYLISGRARFIGGEALDEAHDAEAGDFIWVPPFLPHVEMNPSKSETARAVVVRSRQDNIVFNLPAPEGWSPPA